MNWKSIDFGESHEESALFSFVLLESKNKIDWWEVSHDRMGRKLSIFGYAQGGGAARRYTVISWSFKQNCMMIVC